MTYTDLERRSSEEIIQETRSRYYISPDLYPDQDYIIPQSTPSTITLIGQPDIPDSMLFHVRSRYAQVGVDVQQLERITDTEFRATVLSQNRVRLPERKGVGSIYVPSPPVTGDSLQTILHEELLVEDEDVILVNQDGNESKEPTHIGIRVNKEVLYEVALPEATGIVNIDHSQNLRQSVAPYLKAVTGKPQGRFVISTTHPVALGNIHLTLQPHVYNGVYHLSSVIIQPSSDWLPLNGDHSGIRLELATMNDEPFDPEMLPDYIFFTAHL